MDRDRNGRYDSGRRGGKLSEREARKEQMHMDAEREDAIGKRPTLMVAFFAFYGAAMAGQAALVVLYMSLYWRFDLRCTLD